MHLTLVLVLIRVILNCAETLFCSREYAPAGLFAWPARQLRYRWTAAGPLSGVLNAGLQHPRYLFLVMLQLGCALALLLPMTQALAMPLLVVVVAVELLSPIRNGAFGMEGSDQMLLVLLVAVTLSQATADPLARAAVVWFIALQALLAYFTSGVVKLQTRPWREGTAIRLVLNTQSYGSPILAGWLEKAPGLSKLMCWGVILFECGFPLIILAGPQTTLALLLCGAFFHLMIAATMGLNGFFWSFVATYPAIFRLSQDVQHLIYLHRIG